MSCVRAAQDCEFTYLSTQILHLLGVEGPKTKEPARYIRFIYNRIILENATVRAAAVSSLAKFGALVRGPAPAHPVLLTRALHDNDDEARPLLRALRCYLVMMPAPGLCARVQIHSPCKNGTSSACGMLCPGSGLRQHGDAVSLPTPELRR